jgi:hypothetical protein
MTDLSQATTMLEQARLDFVHLKRLSVRYADMCGRALRSHEQSKGLPLEQHVDFSRIMRETENIRREIPLPRFYDIKRSEIDFSGMATDVWWNIRRLERTLDNEWFTWC